LAATREAYYSRNGGLIVELPTLVATRTPNSRNAVLGNTTCTAAPLGTCTMTPLAVAAYLPEPQTTGATGEFGPRETTTVSSISTMTTPTLREQPDPPSCIQDVSTEEALFTNRAPGYVVPNSTTLPEQRRNKNVVLISRRKLKIVVCITAIVVVGLVVGLVLTVLGRDILGLPTTVVKETRSPSSAPTLDVGSITLSRILERGSLVCAVVDQVGYSTINSDTGEREGFDIDLARAVSAGIFGSGDNVTFVSTTYSDRFMLLTANSSDVDVIIGASTHTMWSATC